MEDATALGVTGMLFALVVKFDVLSEVFLLLGFGLTRILLMMDYFFSTFTVWNI